MQLFNGPMGLALTTALLAAPAFGQADECSQATDLGAGPTSAAFDTNVCSDTGVAATTSAELQCFSLSDDVWFRWTATATGIATFDTCNAATFDTEIAVWEGSDCSTLVPLGCNDDAPGCQLFTSLLSVSVTAGATYYVQIGDWNAVPGDAFGAGTLSIDFAFDPCVGDADFLEPNFDCASAVPLGSGTYTSLDVQADDNDYYSIAVADGATVTVDAFFIDVDGDVDLYLWDPSIICDTNVAGPGSGSGALDVGFSASDNEQVTYTNFTGAAQDLVLEVDLFDDTGCNAYDLVISGAEQGPGPLGTPFCDPANPNSTGIAGQTTAFGRTSIASNDVQLSVANVPPGQFGIFLTSLTQTPPTPVADGLLCLGLAIGRYQHEGDVWQAAPDGTASLQIDLMSIPSPSGPVAAMAGESRSFQAWHRDRIAGSTTSNFTNGVEITFVP